MAKWTVSSSSFSTTAGAATSEQVVELIISPNQGFSIEAKNFKIGKGSEVSTNKWVATGGVFWNADPNVKSVLFENRDGIDGVVNDFSIGSTSNTVKVSVKLNSFTAPSGSTTLYIDIDEREDNPIVTTGEEPRDVCLNVNWNYNENQTATITGSGLVSSADIVAGDANNRTEKKLTGTVPNGVTSVIATITFSASTGYYFVGGFNGANFNIPNYNNGVYDQAYSVVKSESNLNGLINEISYLVYYTPPLGFDDSVDVMGNTICALQHSLSINTIVPQIPVVAENTISGLSNPPDATHVSGSEPIQVFGIKDTPYLISVEKKTSTTSDITAASNGHYNFTTRLFQTAKAPFKSKIGKNGITSHSVLLPSTATKERYDITLSGLVDGKQSVLASEVPTIAGDAKIIKHGVNTLTIKPITYSSNFDTLPSDATISKPMRFKNDGYQYSEYTEFTVAGGTAGVSSTRLVLNASKILTRIRPGMIVTGSGVTHNSTVSKVNGNIVTLSTVSTIAASTNITFSVDNGCILPFSFTIAPDSTTLNVNASADLFENIGGFRKAKGIINGTAAKTITHTLDSTKGIVPGMVVTGDQVRVDAGTNLTVASITSATVLVLSEAQTFINGAGLRFSNENAAGSTRVISAQVNKVGSNIVITGYVNATGLASTAEARVYIDNMITVT